jgi:hypothetical protein
MKSNVLAETENLRETQKYKYTFSYGLSVAVPNDSNKTALITIEQDADFKAEKLTGHVIAPANQNGVRQTAGATDYPLVGTTAGYAEHGVSVKITDSGAGRELTSGFVPLELLLTPGYREQFYIPFPWTYFARRNTKLKFEFMNRDTATGLYHFVSLQLKGYKYTTPAPR